MEAARIVDYAGMDALVQALQAEKCLVWLISAVTHLLRLGSTRYARQTATKILTPAEWAEFPAAREKARRAQMAAEKISFDEVTRCRAWWLAPADLKAKVRALPDCEQEGGSEFDLLVQVDEAAARELHQTAFAQIAELITTKKLRLVRGGRNVSAKLKGGPNAGPTDKAGELATEAECTLLELVEAGLPEWIERGRADRFTPIEFQGPVAVLQECSPDCLDENGRFVEPGWRRIEDGLRREITPAKLAGLHQVVASCQTTIRVFLACKTIVKLFSQELGLDLVPPPLREEEDALRGMLAVYNQLVEISREGEPDEYGFVPPDRMLQLPSDLGLPLIDLEELEPDPGDVETMRQRLATPLGEVWWDAALALADNSTLPAVDVDCKEQLRQSGREFGWSSGAAQVI